MIADGFFSGQKIEVYRGERWVPATVTQVGETGSLIIYYADGHPALIPFAMVRHRVRPGHPDEYDIPQ